MGRTLEALKRLDGTRPGAPKGGVPDCVLEWSMTEEEAPYIEVGGPGKVVEFSPGLLIEHPPQFAVPSPHAHATVQASSRVSELSLENWPASTNDGVSKAIVAFHDPRCPKSEEYRAVFRHLLTKLGDPPAKNLAFTPLESSLSVSMMLLNLATVAAAELGQRVIYVETNTNGSSASQQLGITPTSGLGDVLSGAAAIEKSVLRTPIPNLDLLAARGQTNASVVGENHDGLPWVAAWVRRRYSMAIIESPPLSDPESSASIATVSDGVYVIASRTQLQRAAKLAEPLIHAMKRSPLGVLQINDDVR